jgi:hypothetical protein
VALSTYYVADAGSDANNGTSAGTPFQTVLHASTVVVPGDTIRLNCGDIFADVVAFSSFNGLTITSYGTGPMPIWQPATHTLNSLQGDALTFLNCDNITVENIEFIGSTKVYTTVIVRIFVFSFNDGLLHNNFTINNCLLHDALGGVLFVNVPNIQTVVANNINFTNSHGYNLTCREAFAVGGPGSNNPLVPVAYYWQNLTVTGNTVTDVTGVSTTSCYGLCFENAADVTATGNSIARIGVNGGPFSGGVSASFGIELLNVGTGTIAGNQIDTVYSNATQYSTANGGCGICLDWTCSNVDISGNHIKNCQGSAIEMLTSLTGNRVNNNILNDNCTKGTGSGTLGVPYGAIDSANGSPVQVINNTVVNLSGQPCFTVQNVIVGGIVALNNSFTTPAGVPGVVLSKAGMPIDGNCYQAGCGLILNKILAVSYLALSTWQAATGGEASGIVPANNYFVQPQPPPSSIAACTAYAPIAGSPLLNAGANMLGTYGVPPQNDFFGTVWTQNVIGAIYTTGLPNAYAGTVYQDSPMAWWRLSEPSGTTFTDSVGSFITGNYSACTLGQPSIVPGDLATSVLFNGTSSTAIVPATTYPYSLSALTISVWIKPTVVNLVAQTIIESQTAVAGTLNFSLTLNSATLTFMVRDVSGNSVLAQFDGFTFAANTQYHIMATWTGTTMTCYINSVSQAPTYLSQVAPSSLTFVSIQIGVNNKPGSTQRWFEGLIGEPALYPSVLSGARASALYNAGVGISYTLSGPSSGSVGIPSANFSITPTSSVNDTITLTSSVGGDTLTPASLPISSGAGVPFTITALTLGAREITATSALSLVVTGSPIPFNASVPFTVSCAATMSAGIASPVVFTPSTTTTDIVVPNDNGAGGAFVPPTFVVSGSSSPVTVEYTPSPTFNGPITFSGSSSQGALFTPATTTVYAVVTDGMVTKCGKLFRLSLNSAGLTSNGNWYQAGVTDVPTTPIFEVNGNVVQTGPPVVDSSCNFVAFLAQCGSVQSLAVVNGGTTGYTAPTITAPGITIGTPVLAVGMLTYAITSPGTGYPHSFAIQIPAIAGQHPSVPACVWVTVVAGAATSVVPLEGSPLSYGIGFNGTTATGISLPGSGALAYASDANGTYRWVNSPIAGGGLIVTATIGHYIQSAPVTSGGSGLLAPPTVTITDSTGAGAAMVPVMTGPLATDVVTHSEPAGWALVTVNGIGGLSAPPATNAAMTNSVGVLEGPIGHTQGFNYTPSMAGGGNIGLNPISQFRPNYYTGKNKLKAADPWQPGAGTLVSQMVLDGNHYMASWTPGGTVTSEFFNWVNGNLGFTDVIPGGSWVLQYDDDFYGGFGGAPANVSLSNVNSVGATLTLTSTVVTGGVVTKTYTVAFTPNVGENLVLTLVMVAGSDGLVHAHNPWVFAPNNTIDRSKPYATDDVVVANLTNNGIGPGVLRFMDAWGGPYTPQVIDVSDILLPTDYSWQIYSSVDGQPTGAPPNQPSFTGTTTAGQPHVTGIANTANLAVGNPIFGPGIPGIVFQEPSTLASTKILSVDSATQITLTNNATLTGVQSLSINPYPAGRCNFSSVRRYSTDPTMPAVPWSSPNVYGSQAAFTSGPDSFGTYLPLTGGPLGNADNGHFITAGVGSSQWAVIELVMSTPHGLKTGQALTNGGQVLFQPDVGFTGTITSGSNQVTNCTNMFAMRVGSIVSVNGQGAGIPLNPYTTITGIAGTTLTLSANASINATNASLVVTAAVTLHTRGAFPIASNALNAGYTSGPLWVTGPNTIAIWITGLGGNTGTTDYVAATTPASLYLPLVMLASNMSFPYEYGLAMCATWPNTACHANVPWGGSDAMYASFGTKAAGILGPGNMLLIELGNEHWNEGNDFVETTFEQQLAYGLKYYPSGTPLYEHFTPSRSTAFYSTGGVTDPMSNGGSMNYLMAAHAHYVIATAFAAAGGNPNNVKLIYGSDYGGTGFTTGAVIAATEFNMPQDLIAIAPYVVTSNSPSFTQACQPAGYAANPNWGNWPVDAMNDFARHFNFFSRLNQEIFSSHYNLMASTSMRLMAYEGGFIALSRTAPFTDQVQQDALYDGSFADVVYCWYAACQNGDPLVANSGMTFASYFSLYQNAPVGQLWKLADGASQTAGLGLSNQFVTPQGGSPGTGNPWGYYQTNTQAPGLLGLQEWIGQQTPPPPPITATTPNTMSWNTWAWNGQSWNGSIGPHIAPPIFTVILDLSDPNRASLVFESTAMKNMFSPRNFTLIS